MMTVKEALETLQPSIADFGDNEDRMAFDVVESFIEARLAEKPTTYQLRPEVGAFAVIMEQTLRKHDDRPGWKDCDAEVLLARLYEEVNELASAINTGSSTVPKESADVANFAMMIADVCMAGTLVQGPKPAPPVVSPERIVKCREFLKKMFEDGNIVEAEYANDLLAILDAYGQEKEKP